MSELLVTEQARLDELEAIVERGVSRFVEVGEALMEIRESLLYRKTHGTFEEYCQDRWQMQRAHAYRLIQSASVANALSPTGDTPASERQARELASLLPVPETMREVWNEAVAKYGDPTSAEVREVIRSRQPVATIGPELAAQRTRRLLVDELDRALCAMESPPSIAIKEFSAAMAGGGPGPLTAERFERAAVYAETFARELRRVEVAS